MSGVQLDFDGGGVSYPIPQPRRLTERQRDLLRYMRAHAALLGNGRMATHHAGMFYVDGFGALRRLESLGLVERVARGYWRAI